MIIRRLSAFTLVELIVVITIVWILSTVWFVSYSWYLTWARDSNRFSQLTKLSDSLQTYAASKSLPLPDDYVEITASWATNVIAYQGYVWVDVLETIDYTNGGKDPKDDSYFTYFLTKDRNSLQMLTFMEDTSSVSLHNYKTFAADYSERFPKTYGKKLWVLTEIDTNIPIQEVNTVVSAWYLDIVNTTSQYTAHISDEEKIIWTGTLLSESIPNGSCKRVKQTWWSYWNGTYIWNPKWAGDILSYCNMEIAWGWWGLVARSVIWWSGSFSPGTWAWLLENEDIPYVSSVAASFYTQAMLATYNTWKDIIDYKIINVSNNYVTLWFDGIHTLTAAGITWWVPWDWFNGEQWMLFVK